MRKESQDKDLKFLEESIVKETEITESVFNELLHEENVPKDRFDQALGLYGNDGDVVNALETISFEASKGILPKENIAEEVLNYEIQEWKKGKSLIKKYLLEDEIWNNWGVEVGDVHFVAKNSKVLKHLYSKIRDLV